LNKNILNTGVQEFIKNNWSTDIVSVLLKKPLFKGISQKELVEQLEAKKKCRDKLPTWFHTHQIYYPNKLNIEQTSSEQTAAYKADLVAGKTLVDITGGFGVDSHFFTQKIDTVIHCEIDQNLSKIAAYNAQILGLESIVFKAVDGIQFLKDSAVNFDWIFIDPSRRNEIKGKVFLLKDCEPNIPELLDDLFKKTKNVLLKTSPLLDIKQGLSELKYVKEVHVVAIKNEVKELLWVLQKGFEGKVAVKTVNLRADRAETFDFYLNDEQRANVHLENPKKYLYEPNAAILKAGAFKILGQTLGLEKLHLHSHLYTSQNFMPKFPGRSFEIVRTIAANKKELKRLGITKANITVRNFPEDVDSIRKKYKFKDGGQDYLFFTTDLKNERAVIQCEKIK
jgi:16S rRNA G966 N2-methylase RsmD